MTKDLQDTVLLANAPPHSVYCNVLESDSQAAVLGLLMEVSWDPDNDPDAMARGF